MCGWVGGFVCVSWFDLAGTTTTMRGGLFCLFFAEWFELRRPLSTQSRTALTNCGTIFKYSIYSIIGVAQDGGDVAQRAI